MDHNIVNETKEDPSAIIQHTADLLLGSDDPWQCAIVEMSRVYGALARINGAISVMRQVIDTDNVVPGPVAADEARRQNSFVVSMNAPILAALLDVIAILDRVTLDYVARLRVQEKPALNS